MNIYGKHPRVTSLNMPRLKTLGIGLPLDESRPRSMTCTFNAWREVVARFDAPAEVEEIL